MRPARTLAYARVSSAEQGQHGTSLEAQREEFDAYCRAHKLPAPRVYVEVESGGAGAEERRIEQARLLAEVRAGDLVLVAKQDRWSRATLYFLRSVQTITDRGARFYAIAERFDPSTPEGKFASTIMAAVAEQEHARIRDRTVGARKRLRALGAWIEGLPPLGYRVDPTTRRLVFDPATVDAAREMWRLATTGLSSLAIGRALLARWPDLRGVDHSGVARRLSSRVYLGQVHTTGRKGDGEWIAAHPPLVDEATWSQVQSARQQRRKGGRRLAEAPRCAGFLLRGLVVCGTCGYHCAAHAPGPASGVRHGGWYICQHREGRGCAARARARHRDLDALVEAEVLQYLQGQTANLAAPPPSTAVVAPLDDERERLLLRRERIAARVVDESLTRDEARKLLDPIAARLTEIEAARDSASPAAVADRRRELRETRALLGSWARLTVDERRAAIRALVAAVVVTQTRAEPYARGAWTHAIRWANDD